MYLTQIPNLKILSLKIGRDNHNDNNHDNSCTDSSVVKDPTSDAGGPRFESHAGRVAGIRGLQSKVGIAITVKKRP